jgi:carbon-monoxide dehydrogenase medium subunit
VKTPRFEYHAPDTLEEVLALLAEHGEEAKILAGGQSLVPLLALRLASPSCLIDVNKLGSLGAIEDRDGTIAFGATVRERAAEKSTLVGDRVPLLAEALPFVGHVAIRNRGTIGGSVAHADASAEIPAVVAALDGEIVVRSTRGERVIAAADFFQSHFSTAMDDDECLVEVRLPSISSGTGWSFQEIARRHGDFALVAVAATVTLDATGSISDSRIALVGVGAGPVRAHFAETAMVGAMPTADTLAAAAHAASADLTPASDVHGTAAFRKHLATVTVRRALTQATQRAGAPA